MQHLQTPCPFGSHRVVRPSKALPQQAEELNTKLPLYENELLIDVECLNIDSSSFHQMKTFCKHNAEKIKAHILDIVSQRGKMQNPVTGSGGMLIGRVKKIGPKFLEGRPQAEKLKIGDRVASLVSLTLTPLKLEAIHKIHMNTDRVDVTGHAILFQSGVYSKLPTDISETLALAVLDVCGAPAHTAAMCKKNQTVVMIGGAGKSGVLSLYEAKKAVGPKGRVIALDYDPKAVEALKRFSFVDDAAVCDARDAVGTYDLVRQLTNGNMADIVINVTNIPDTEMSCILSAKKGGTIYFFSTATSFTKAALGSEGVGSNTLLVMGNGYKPGHAELTLNILRESPEIRKLYESRYGPS